MFKREGKIMSKFVKETVDFTKEMKFAQWLSYRFYENDTDQHDDKLGWLLTAREVLKEYVSREDVGFALVLFKKKISEIRKDHPGLQRVSAAIRELEDDLLK